MLTERDTLTNKKKGQPCTSIMPFWFLLCEKKKKHGQLWPVKRPTTTSVQVGVPVNEPVSNNRIYTRACHSYALITKRASLARALPHSDCDLYRMIATFKIYIPVQYQETRCTASYFFQRGERNRMNESPYEVTGMLRGHTQITSRF